MAKQHLDIILETANWVAINKPAGMLSIPDREQSQPSLKDLLIEKYGKIYTVHRLDRETSGVIIFAKNDTTHRFLSQRFEGRGVQKLYQGLVLGIPNPLQGTIDAPIREHSVEKGLMIVHQKGKPCITDYEVVEQFKYFALVNFELHTGRTHQIRVHCKNMGTPLTCDPLYGNGKPILLSTYKKKFNLSKDELEERPMLNRVALHSYQLSFVDETEKKFTLTADLPKDLRALCTQLKKIFK